MREGWLFTDGQLLRRRALLRRARARNHQMSNFYAVFTHVANFKRDRNKSYDWLPALVTKFSLSKEKLTRKERGVAVHGWTTAPTTSTGWKSSKCQVILLCLCVVTVIREMAINLIIGYRLWWLDLARYRRSKQDIYEREASCCPRISAVYRRRPQLLCYPSV